ncbi:peptidase [Streptomyces sp. 150FB]|uniref:M23 family metallopeptidase n=1 Tax=Streptomyces sp. 150FB TaxID=1576605 RepID=UPI0005896C79|nr:M23 family metallopeptidase [Streptomyces sp. 150FB]KIF76016.1 peptidase [Streptomyces sp. 150FB]
MWHPTQSRLSRASALRNRTALLAAGLGVSIAAGAGTAVAATGGHGDAGSAAVAPEKAGASATSVLHDQAVAQKSAATKHTAAVKAEHVKKIKEAAAKAASWQHPVNHYKLSAPFGLGGNMWSHKHSGQDFAVPVGTAVHAAHQGTVVKAGPGGAGDGSAYGNAIVIRHADHTYSQYAHLSKINVHVGQHVNTDQSIARSGNTGNTSGPHLHFEIRKTANYGSAINPVNFLHSEGVKV